VCIALDETVREEDLQALFAAFGGDGATVPSIEELADASDSRYDERFKRTTPFMTHPVFNVHRSETEILRYMHKLESRDLSLVHSMIPLGSCTMKLNATAEMMPITWPGFSKLHPFAPVEQAEGYRELFAQLELALAEITGFPAVSLQPNAGSQGEYAGLLAIHAYHASRNESHRDVCLIPQSAHGTNPASAVMAGMKVVVVRTDARGNIDIADLRAKARAVLQLNDRGEFTTPSRNQYPHQWNWDSALIALGLSHFDMPRARAEIRSLLRAQWRDGMMPHIIYHHGASDYFPHREFWQTGSLPHSGTIASSGLTQPPVLAIVVRMLHERSGDDESLAFLREVFPALRGWHRWRSTRSAA